MSAEAAARIRRIGLERVRDLYGVRGSPILAGVIVSAMVALQAGVWVWLLGSKSGALIWTAIAVAVEVVLAALVWAFHRRDRADAELPAWGRARTLAEAAHGASWALIVPLGVVADKPLSLLIVIMTLIALGTASSAGLAVHLPAFLAFAGTIMGVSAAFLLQGGGTTNEVVAIALGTTAVFTVLNALRMSAIYRQLIEGRLDLADQLEARQRLQAEAEAARQVAENATAERTRFFGAASHDLRQPVHALGLYAELLRRDPPVAERRDLIGRITACVDSLESLFNAILSIARPMVDEAPARRGAIRVADAVERVVMQFQPEAARRGLSLELRPGPDAWAYGDAQALERIVGNLVSNALRYTPAGGVVARVRQSGEGVRIIVSDTGVGLSREEAERIFDPFYRLPAAGAGEREGFGLGLATVRELCRAHSYRCRVRSRPEQGSLFQVWLPAAPPGPVAAAPPPSALPKGLKVLVVEDDRHVVDAVSRLLGAWGVEAVARRTGDEAMTALLADPSAAWHVLLDYRLARDETGLEVAARIREAFGDRLPLTLVTGEADPELFDEAQRDGLQVLRKPLKPIRLRALLAAQPVR